MESSLVSVVMATFNEPVNYITAAIKSILEQSYTNIELIIVDDSTNEETVYTINYFAKEDKRVKVLRESVRIGFVKALNKGLQEAKGQYIARMDGDDIAESNRLEVQWKYMELHKNIDVLGGDMNIIDERGIIVSKRCYPTNKAYLWIWSLFRTPLGHPTVMFRRTIIDSNLLYNVSFCKAEDIEFWLRLKNKGYHFANLAYPVLNYRVCGDLSKKRTAEHWYFNYQARKKNFAFSTLLYSTMSISISWLYTLIPITVVEYLYSRENNRLKK